MAAKDSSDDQGHFHVPDTHKIIQDILSEKGIQGFWSGYSASLVLTLNPSITFFLFENLKRVVLPRHRRANPPPSLTFLLSALSKACASSITYPFSLAKARLQAGGAKSSSHSEDASTEENVVKEDVPTPQGRRAARATIFSTVLTIAQTEGIQSLYEGLPLEILRAFFSHGLTMLVKQSIQRLLVRAYYVMSIIVGRYQRKAHRGANRLSAKAKGSAEYYNLAMARASQKLEETKTMIQQRANETAEFVGEYVEEEDGQWRELYGTVGLARWLDKDRGL